MSLDPEASGVQAAVKSCCLLRAQPLSTSGVLILCQAPLGRIHSFPSRYLVLRICRVVLGAGSLGVSRSLSPRLVRPPFSTGETQQRGKQIKLRG